MTEYKRIVALAHLRNEHYPIFLIVDYQDTVCNLI